MGIIGWKLDEHLINGPNNGPNVTQIIQKTLRNSVYGCIVRPYLWPGDLPEKYIKSVLHQQYNYQKEKMRQASLSLSEQDSNKKRKNYQTRKTHVS